VIVPTHDHGRTLRPAVGSALAQTHEHLEVLIVGDGMPPEAAAVARELADGDHRIHLFEFEKGERHGEAHRDRVLREHATGELVLYLSDDDLWHPAHAASMVAALAEADFAAAPCVRVHTDGSFDAYPHDLSRPETRELMLAEPRHYNHVVLSGGGHTRAAYDRRERGWEPAPPGIWTDLHFWRGFVAGDAFRCRSTDTVTVFNFASPERVGMGQADRAAELERFWPRLADAESRATVEAEVSQALRRGMIAVELDYQVVYDALADYQRWSEDLRGQVADLDAARERLQEVERLPEVRLRRVAGRALARLRDRRRDL